MSGELQLIWKIPFSILAVALAWIESIDQFYQNHFEAMSIRQIRLNSIEQIKSRVREFEGKRIQVILSNNTSMYGELKSVEALGIVMENQRLKRNLLPFDTITEIYFDQQL